jgi:hypothetical protein
MTDRFDQTARFTARFDPEGFLAWLLPGFAEHLRFERWLDTRTAPQPGRANQTADTLAELSALRRVESPWLLLLEFQTEPDPIMFGRLLGELGKFWIEHVPDELPGSRYQLAAAVVNLTGTTESLPASRTFDFPLEDIRVGLSVKEMHLASQNAGATLEAVARGRVAKSILTFVPLMTGGGEDAIIQRWLEVAATETDHRRRDDLGTLAMTMADLKPWRAGWQRALKEWNMRESTFVQGWIDEGIEKGRKEGIEKGKKEGKREGRAETLRENIRTILTTRFGAVPSELLRRIDGATKLTQLDRAFKQALTVEKPEDLRL